MKTKSRIRKKVLGSKDESLFEFRARGKDKKNTGARNGAVQRRSQSEKVRRRTLGVEMDNRTKRGEFRDERIGEKSENLTEEDKLIARLRQQHSKRTKNRANFNLEDVDDELDILTHGGTAIDEFSDDQLNESGEDEEQDADDRNTGLTSAEGVEMLNFGGGLVEKAPAETGEDGRPKTHAEVMAEIIAKSKMYRDERAKDKLEMEAKTDKLDAALGDILPGLQKGRPRNAAEQSAADKEYDQMFAELATEKRAIATDRLKTPEELAKEEKERLDALEATRLRRMKGTWDEDAEESEGEPDESKNISQSARRGGDDLEDDFVGNRSDETDGESAEESDSEDPDVGGDHGAGHEASKKGVRFEEAVSSEDSDESEGEDEFEYEETDAKADEGDDSIPFTFGQCPSTNKHLLKLFRGRSSRQRGVIVKRLLKSFALPLNPSVNRPLLAGLLSALLGRFDRIAESSTPYWTEIGELLPCVYELSVIFPETSIEWAKGKLEMIQERLIELGPEFSSVGEGGLIILRILARLFPLSDLRHPVTTPAVLLLANVISFGSIRTQRDLCLSCFAIDLFAGALSAGGRISGELLRFCSSIAASAGVFVGESSSIRFREYLLPSHRDGLLQSRKPWKLPREGLSISIPGITNASADDTDWRMVAFQKALGSALTCSRATANSGNNAISAAFGPFISVLELLVSERPSDDKQNHIFESASECLNELREVVENAEQGRSPLALYEKPVTAPKALNPRFGPRSGRSNAEYKEKVKSLKRQLRKEERGAARELRKDASFVARERLAKEDVEDAKRAKKAREVMAFLEKQESTWKQQEKKKRKETGKW
ncbi:hypothetical protein NDN08_002325 [Rhodosorus marinus]|uniref:Nucleolar protein 14 n=1 Tax=Rhodosorus marinus TaxID=101924 RepID=A0AAV8UTE3_9RHOD|nr:hypothetical protein NDN08_002325 [Rhodosorus marinus]